MRRRIHFEIGHEINYPFNTKRGVDGETESVFKSTFISDCLDEFTKKGYTTPEYFIDVWETDTDGIPYPLADIKIDAWTVADYKPAERKV